MPIKSLRLSTLLPADYNPRQDLKPDDKRFKALAKSIDEFGLVQPLIFNTRTKTLVGGHQRLKVLLARGETHAEAVIVDLPPDKEKALNLALNRISGGWDKDKLAQVLEELVEMPSLDLEVTGFDMPEVEQLLSEALDPGNGEDQFDLERAMQNELAPITKPGELIRLGLHGEHRLLCGDATSSADMAQLMEDRRASLVHADPPYGVNYDPRNRPGAKKTTPCPHPRSGRIQNDDLSPKRYRQWFLKVVAQLSEAMVPGGPIYLWNAHKNFGLMTDLLREHGFHVASILTWAKESPVLSFADYSEQTELCLYGWKSGARHKWYGPRNESTLWRVNRDRTRQYQHPTQKALALAERAIRNSSKPGDLVFDPFLGSGTTLMASALMGRECRGLEIDPKYCDIIVRRYIAMAGKGAVSREIAERYAVEEERS